MSLAERSRFDDTRRDDTGRAGPEQDDTVEDETIVEAAPDQRLKLCHVMRRKIGPQ